jgi:ubiquitin carboxyl-terminal hydrolase 4/11
MMSMFGGSLGQKIDVEVDFPLNGLDLTQHVIGANFQEGNMIYDCYAVSNHMGGCGGGHYTAFAKNPHNNKWISYNDSMVDEVRNTEAPERQVVSSSAYNLFYRRRDWHENNVKNGCNFDAMALKPDMSLITKK